MLPILNPPASPYHPSGSSQCTSPKHPYRAMNLDWHLVSYMTFHMFQCHSPQSSHPLPLPQVIHFKCNSVYTSIPNSLAILSSHASSLATVSLFAKSVTLKLNFLKVISNLIFQSSGEMEIIYPGNSDCLTDESFLLWHEAPTLGSCVFSPLPSLVLYVYLKWARLVQTFQPLSRGH